MLITHTCNSSAPSLLWQYKHTPRLCLLSHLEEDLLHVSSPFLQTTVPQRPSCSYLLFSTPACSPVLHTSIFLLPILFVFHTHLYLWGVCVHLSSLWFIHNLLTLWDKDIQVTIIICSVKVSFELSTYLPLSYLLSWIKTSVNLYSWIGVY